MDDLIAALASDLDGAFPSLVESAGPGLYWGLRRLCGDHQEAEDLTQETFIRAYRALGDFDRRRFEELRLSPWLWTIALNLGRNHLRNRSRRPTFVEIGDHGRHDSEPPDTAAWDARFSALPASQRRAVVLRHVVGMGISDIAAATGRPEGTVKADIHRGLERLRRVMEQER
ncbi:MAG TPA: RNA polymerase sigma factor [Acidimicrobiia bacterium]|nr:RNA polymerase sigma factor [Acidimicrobiia bacterium]